MRLGWSTGAVYGFDGGEVMDDKTASYEAMDAYLAGLIGILASGEPLTEQQRKQVQGTIAMYRTHLQVAKRQQEGK